MRIQKILFLLLFLVASCAEDTRNWAENKFPGIRLTNVFWTSSQFVVFGVTIDNDLIIYTSTNGRNWLLNTYNRKFPYGQGTYYLFNKFVVENSNVDYNEILITSDLLNWITITPTIRVSCSIIFDGTQYYSCAEVAQINECVNLVTSPDLMIWTARPLESNWCFDDLYFENSKFFAKIHFKDWFPDYYAYVRSNDGLHWQEISMFRGRNMKQITHADKFYMVGDWGGIYSSNDGKEWEDHSMFLGPMFQQIVKSANDYFILSGSADWPSSGDQEILSTPDFVSWKSYLYKEAIPWPSSIFNYSTGKLWDMATNGVVTVVVGEEDEGYVGGQYGVILTTE